MGYRSDVKIVVGCDNAYWFKKFLIHLELMVGDNMHYKEIMSDATEFADPDITGDGTNSQRTMYWHYDYIKWYPSFDFVQLHNRIMQEVQDFKGGYAFVRVGEEEGDVEAHHREYDSNCVFEGVIMIQTTSDFQIDEIEVIEPYISPRLKKRYGVTA